MSQAPKFVRNNNLVERKLGDETVLVPITQVGVDVQSIYSLNATAASIWEKLITPITIEELICLLENEYEADEGVIRKNVETIIDDFIQSSFISEESV